uniref:Uncharacterized protein n=1 Tax=Romanomermis culicivorax TaxID=13658 RepID=A0A915I1F3_ROMCU
MPRRTAKLVGVESRQAGNLVRCSLQGSIVPNLNPMIWNTTEPRRTSGPCLSTASKANSYSNGTYVKICKLDDEEHC